jgi:broad specificity phosphatase PhoE
VPIGQSHGLEIVGTQGLREIYAGEWEGRLFDELCEE